MVFGVVVMGTVGALIGTFLGYLLHSSDLRCRGASGAGWSVFLAAVDFVSILVGTVLGGARWMIAGVEKISLGPGAGAAMGGFLGVQISMLLDVRAARKGCAGGGR